jgi:hypothetical protein
MSTNSQDLTSAETAAANQKRPYKWWFKGKFA